MTVKKIREERRPRGAGGMSSGRRWPRARRVIAVPRNGSEWNDACPGVFGGFPFVGWDKM
ncbi:MAG: hypothetical protein Q4C47_07245 [Planctomycetia bacterium]|nr:hypothetical protein [Planctomycetia bacterium]